MTYYIRIMSIVKTPIILTILAIFLCLFPFFSLSAQSIKQSATTSFDAGGIKIGEKATQNTIVNLFGKPTRIDVCNNETCYYYGDSGLLFINDELYSAIIKNNQIAVLSEIIPGGIRVGDNADETKNKLSHYTDDTIVDVGNGFRVGGNDDWVLFDTKKGVITEIFYCLETP